MVVADPCRGMGAEYGRHTGRVAPSGRWARRGRDCPARGSRIPPRRAGRSGRGQGRPARLRLEPGKCRSRRFSAHATAQGDHIVAHRSQCVGELVQMCGPVREHEAVPAPGQRGRRFGDDLEPIVTGDTYIPSMRQLFKGRCIGGPWTVHDDSCLVASRSSSSMRISISLRSLARSISSRLAPRISTSFRIS